MEIKGKTIQGKNPMPDEPIEMNHNISVNVNGETVEIPYNNTKIIEKIFKIKGEWYVKYRRRVNKWKK